LSRRRVPTIGIVAALALAAVSPMAHAQLNIDQGKSPAEIFATDCAVCHKTTRGLANGKNSLMLSSFLREHYTASRDQAAALAAYVLGAGGSGPAPPAPGQKPGPERARAAVEEPKTAEPKTAEPKMATHPTHPSAKPEERAPATASRGHKQEPETAPPVHQLPAAAVATPAVNETPSTDQAPSTAQVPNQDFSPTTSAVAPTEAQPSDSEPVPRDNIPD